MEGVRSEFADVRKGSEIRPLRVLTAEQRADSARSIENLKDEITRLAGHLNAANHRFLMLIAEFDRREGWSDGGTQSCAHWLNWKCGIEMGAAREKVRVARALENLPKISAAMARGELSYSKVRELTRVACDGNGGLPPLDRIAWHCPSRREAGSRFSAREGCGGALARSSTAGESIPALSLRR